MTHKLDALADELVHIILETLADENNANTLGPLAVLHVMGRVTSSLAGTTMLTLHLAGPDDPKKQPDFLEAGARVLLKDVQGAMQSAISLALVSDGASAAADDFMASVMRKSQ
jgi:hypothetical protein